MRRMWMVAVVALVLAACGGDGGGTGDTDAPVNDTVAAEPADDGGTDTTAAPEADEPAEDDANTASAGAASVGVVTIGDQSYEFEMDPENAIHRCEPDFFNAFWALGGGVEMLLPPPDDPNHTDPPRITVKDETSGLEWVADSSANQEMDPQVPEGDSQVDSFVVEGNTATGTATFIEQNAVYAWIGGTADAPEPVEGTFEVTCADE